MQQKQHHIDIAPFEHPSSVTSAGSVHRSIRRLGAPARRPRTGRRWRWRLIRPLALGGVGVIALWGWSSEADAASVRAAIKNNVLTVTGTAGSDAITLRLQAGNPNMLEVDAGADGTADFRFDRSRFTDIMVKAGGGNDKLVIEPSSDTFTNTERTTLKGEAGKDTLLGGNGNETLDAGAGDDLVDGNFGVDVIVLGDGADRFQWDPGDSSDTIDGGGGSSDRVVFNGSAADEIFEVVPNGDRVRLTRNVANVVADIDRIEAVEIHTLAGLDTINTANTALSGFDATDLTTIDADLSGFGGTDDAQLDSVRVASGVVLRAEGTTGVVDGLGARVRVLNGGTGDEINVVGGPAVDIGRVQGSSNPDVVSTVASGTDVVVQGATGGVLARFTDVQLLDVDLLAGDDQFAAVGNLAALTTLDVDGGTGNDTLRGGNGADLLNGGQGADFVDGNQGVDTLIGGDHNDVFQWDPGDGNDVVTGNAGTDELVFNGSAANELIDVSAANGRVRLFRDIANITLDIDDVESLDLRPLGGADAVSVSSLAGTDLLVLESDFAAFGGVDDVQIDELRVPPGVTLGEDGAAGTVDGLGAKLRVVNGVPGDSIHVTGPTAADTVLVAGTSSADLVSAVADGTDAVLDGATGSVFARFTGVELLDIGLAGGHDQFSAVGNLAVLTTLDVDGGDGNDTLRGGNGLDLLSGAGGADFVDGNQGNDTLAGGDNDDVFQWDPGDGNDVIAGGAGVDELVFNGSAANELLDVSAIGDHARLFRNIASISIDLDDVESLELRALGGADSATVHPLSGTDLEAIDIDFGAIGGVDDLQTDEVLAPLDVVLGHDGSAGVIDGLGPKVRVVNGFGLDAIHLIGTDDVDTATVGGTEAADVVVAVADGTDAVLQGVTGNLLARFTAVELLDVGLAGGDDQFSAIGNLAAITTLQVNGGEGADTLRGGNGADMLDGGPGADFVDGNQGVDVLVGGDGEDVVQWDPGDGNDSVVGGADSDRLVFNGSAIGELIDVAANGDRARLTRNIASIVLDIDDVESVIVNVFGGGDVITVDDLSGTDVKAVVADLGLIGGGDDAQGDQVVVNGTNGDDVINVVDDAAEVVVGGLHADVRVAHAGPTTDLLTVNGGDGVDQVTVTPGAGSLILLTLLP